MGVAAGADTDPRTSASCIVIDNHHFGPRGGVDWVPGGIPANITRSTTNTHALAAADVAFPATSCT